MSDEKTEKGTEEREVGEAFFSDSFSVLFNPGKFLLDIKQKVPFVEHEEGGHRQKNKVHHNTVIMDPLLAKKLSKALDKNIENYEERFGSIEAEGKEESSEEEEEKEKVSYIG